MATGRQRAASDPFWATSLDNMVGGRADPPTGVAGIIVGLYWLIRRSPALRDFLWMGSGWRPGSVEHGSGRAIDIIVSADVGVKPTSEERQAAMALINFLVKNASRLKVQWILFSRDGLPRTQSWNADRGTWKNLSNRGSVPANHVDHIHVYFKEGASWPSILDEVSLGGSSSTTPPKPAPTPAPGLPTTGVDNTKYPGREAFVLGRSHTAVTTLGKRLVAHGYGRFYKVGPGPRFTSVDQAAVRAFQVAQGWTGRDADGYPGPETWRRLMAAPTQVLKEGDRGARVEDLQEGLNRVFPSYRHHVAPKGRKLSVDGVFGSHTEGWVKRFQELTGLKVDGVVGANTRAMLARYGIKA